MNIEKKNETFRQECATFKNQFGGTLQVYYEGDILYFESEKNELNNMFYITKKDWLLYMGLEELFCYLRRYDNLHYMPLERMRRFEWVSEGTGVPEAQDRLVIEDCGNMFQIHLEKNKFNKRKDCLVGISLTASNYPQIAKIFDDTFISTLKYPYIFKRRFKPQENSCLK